MPEGAPLSLFQSLVLVSRLPYVNLFQRLLQLVAPEYFDKLTPCLEAGEWLAPAEKQALSAPGLQVWLHLHGAGEASLASLWGGGEMRCSPAVEVVGGTLGRLREDVPRAM